jgi:transposase
MQTMILTTNLPSDVTTLQALLQDSEERNGRKDDRIERLEKLVADFKRALFGSKSEKVSTDQYELALEDIEAAIAAIHTEGEQDVSPLARPKEPRRSNRGSLPQHLPRVEEIITPDNIICDCGCERHIWRRCLRAFAYRAIPVSCAGHAPPQVCVSCV